jgi:hypothetical protein
VPCFASAQPTNLPAGKRVTITHIAPARQKAVAASPATRIGGAAFVKYAAVQQSEADSSLLVIGKNSYMQE